MVRGLFRVSTGEPEGGVAQKLEVGLTSLGLHSVRNLGLLLHLLGLRVPEDALAGLDDVLIGLRTRELLQQLVEARCKLSPVLMLIEDLHWTDSASEELLGKIVDGESKLRLLLIHTRGLEYTPRWLNHVGFTRFTWSLCRRVIFAVWFTGGLVPRICLGPSCGRWQRRRKAIRSLPRRS